MKLPERTHLANKASHTTTFFPATAVSTMFLAPSSVSFVAPSSVFLISPSVVPFVAPSPIFLSSPPVVPFVAPSVVTVTTLPVASFSHMMSMSSPPSFTTLDVLPSVSKNCFLGMSFGANFMLEPALYILFLERKDGEVTLILL